MPRPYLALAAVAALASIARADDLPDDQMGPYQFSGVINADNVYVRSYSSENDYPVTKLSKGDPVTVVGNRGDWLKILPPSDTFCLVGKAWVDARSNGTVGRVRDDAVNIPVRLGSNVVPQYGKIVTQVTAGQDVKILGQVENAYYKIAPPPGTFAYVHMRFVDLIKRVEVVNDHGALAVKPTGEPPLKPKAVDAPPPGPQLVKTTPTPPDATPATQPAAVVAAAPTTKPSTEATAAFDALEARFMAASKQSLADQPIDALSADYQKALDAKALPDSMLKVAEYRLAGLKLRQEAAVSLKQVEIDRKKQQEAQVALAAEGQEISEKMAANEFKRYTAVGTLRPSALPNNGKPLYRLTDPMTGRTVVYVSDTAGTVAAMDGKFVGVRGVVADDAARQIKLLTPQAVEPIDPAEVTRGAITSTMAPASLTATSDASR